MPEQPSWIRAEDAVAMFGVTLEPIERSRDAPALISATALREYRVTSAT